MRIGQGIRTGLGHRASPVSYRHNFLILLGGGVRLGNGGRLGCTIIVSCVKDLFKM